MYVNIPYNQITPKNLKTQSNSKNSGLLCSAFNQNSPTADLTRMRESPEYDPNEIEEDSGDCSELSDRVANTFTNRKTMSFYNHFQKKNDARRN